MWGARRNPCGSSLETFTRGDVITRLYIAVLHTSALVSREALFMRPWSVGTTFDCPALVASWPHADRSSSPRVSRIVQSSLCSQRRCWNAWTACADGWRKSVPSGSPRPIHCGETTLILRHEAFVPSGARGRCSCTGSDSPAPCPAQKGATARPAAPRAPASARFASRGPPV